MSGRPPLFSPCSPAASFAGLIGLISLISLTVDFLIIPRKQGLVFGLPVLAAPHLPPRWNA